MKIVYVIDSLASKGGAERILTDKMNYLSDSQDYEVYVICCYQKEETFNAYPLSNKVVQINLAIPFYSQYKYKYPIRLWVKMKIAKTLRERLLQRIRLISPMIICGVGYFSADVICKIKYCSYKIIEMHEPRMFTLSNTGLHRSFLSNLFMSMYRHYYFRIVEKNADVVVTLTEGDAYQWKKAKRIEVIPNFTNMPVVKSDGGIKKRVIAVGRLEWEKGFDRLINVWNIVLKKHSDWSLEIFGSGTLKDELVRQISELKISDNIMIHPFTSNINIEYSKSSFLVSTSRFEGFSLVILEAMRCGIPCVAFDCPYGPRTIIEDGRCGFLVKDDNIELLASKIIKLIEEPKLLNAFSKESLVQAEKFKMSVVMDKWEKLYKDLINE